MNPADRIVQVLADAGRRVDAHDVRNQLDALAGLAPDDAEQVVLATYGIGADGRPLGGFVADHGPVAALWSVLRSGRAAVVYVLVAACAAIIPGLAIPLLVRLLMDRYAQGDGPSWLPAVLLGLVLSGLLVATIRWLQVRVLGRLAVHLNGVGVMRYAWHSLRLPVPDITRDGPGVVAGRLGMARGVAYQAGMLIPLAAANALSVVAFAAALTLLSPALGGVAIATAILSVAASTLVLRRRRVAQDRAARAQVELFGITASLVQGIEGIKAPAWERHALHRWAAEREYLGAAVSRLGVANQWGALVPALSLALSMALLLGVGTALVWHGSITLGTLVAAQSFLTVMFSGLALLVWFGTLFQSVTSAVAIVDQVRRRPLDPEVVADPVARAPVQQKLAGALRLRGITFGYDRDAPPLIDALDLDVAPGRRVALVGGSGSGKTTIARLVTGELAPWGGEVLLDGHPRIVVPADVRARSVAYVPQTPVLLPGTISENLGLWNPEVGRQDIQRAAVDACIDAAILDRRGGFEAHVDGGDGGFSGGELQRLAIARALAGNPTVLVLDEATSALDPVVEADVEAALRRRGCTCLVIAHRLSTVRDADEILVLDAGRVVQRGTYAELAGAGTFGELLHA